ncbi:response regulator [Sedimentisphaera salicampi]|uniref:Transcriptional regulatory protein UhpA n=1 Tax=Sedimentisphaera salicampi TaxID=1941349 RepID=A0A1W6LQD1_9BACT|nr:response regulator transcription factor [Sedimentisphaera salicampi]ARN57974.1 Transcriptional regulatory protein UhpA [Sedimentisphaera salicampi]OXU14139.1 Transcriptional regulatory protein UhpA [Sedimentisphaera salicampi]
MTEENTKRKRILLADDHFIVARGLVEILEESYDLVGIAKDGVEMVKMATELKPELIVADISMPNLNGIDALKELKKKNSEIKVVFLTMHDEPAYARRAIDAGASGFVVKSSAPDELAQAISLAFAGGIYISPSIQKKIDESQPSADDFTADDLTKRQKEILQLLSHGKSAKEIASDLNISSRTVEFHKYRIMKMLGIDSSAGLVRFAIKQGIAEV